MSGVEDLVCSAATAAAYLAVILIPHPFIIAKRYKLHHQDILTHSLFMYNGII